MEICKQQSEIVSSKARLMRHLSAIPICTRDLNIGMWAEDRLKLFWWNGKLFLGQSIGIVESIGIDS